MTRNLASYDISALWAFFPESKLNQLSNSVLSLKMSGIIKLSRLHNSVMLFCSGVPVSSSLRADFSLRDSLIVIDSLFFSLWASSNVIRYQLKLGWRISGTYWMASYVVTQTSNYPGCIFSCRQTSRVSLRGSRFTTRSSGAQWRNSFIQFDMVLLGAITKWGLSFINLVSQR